MLGGYRQKCHTPVGFTPNHCQQRGGQPVHGPAGLGGVPALFPVQAAPQPHPCPAAVPAAPRGLNLTEG